MTARRTVPRRPEAGELVRDESERHLYRFDGEQWAEIRRVVLVGEARLVDMWRRSADLLGVDVITVTSRYDERKLRGLDGRGVLIVRGVAPGGRLPDVEYSLAALRQRGAVDAPEWWPPR